ncbi:MAG: sirohydrochlorin cobaltochelatase [Deferribacterales bacterium]
MRALILSAVVMLFTVFGVFASENSMEKQKTAVVIAAFGTTYDSALSSLLSISHELEKNTGDIPVRMAFTSNIIRKIWHSRKNDTEYRNSHKEVPEYLYDVKNVLGTLADLQNEGYKTVVVQPTYIYAGEEYADLLAYTDALNGIKTLKDKWKPFTAIAVGKPVTGAYEYKEDLNRFAEVLKADVDLARKNKTALVYMGHGNEHLSTGIYFELEIVMNAMYPDVKTFIGTVEGHPDVEDVIAGLKRVKAKSVTLKPLMIVAGDHAQNDMASDEEDSWKTLLSKAGIRVIPVVEGLGENPGVRKIIADNMKKAAEENGIKLH